MVRPLREYIELEARSKVKAAFQGQRSGAKLRGIVWGLTFEEWSDIWLASGKWSQRGNRSNQYCMARKFDEGGYFADNVKIITNYENQKEKTNERWRTQYGEGLTKNTRT